MKIIKQTSQEPKGTAMLLLLQDNQPTPPRCSLINANLDITHRSIMKIQLRFKQEGHIPLAPDVHLLFLYSQLSSFFFNPITVPHIHPAPFPHGQITFFYQIFTPKSPFNQAYSLPPAPLSICTRLPTHLRQHLLTIKYILDTLHIK